MRHGIWPTFWSAQERCSCLHVMCGICNVAALATGTRPSSGSALSPSRRSLRGLLRPQRLLQLLDLHDRFLVLMNLLQLLASFPVVVQYVLSSVVRCSWDASSGSHNDCGSAASWWQQVLHIWRAVLRSATWLTEQLVAGIPENMIKCVLATLR